MGGGRETATNKKETHPLPHDPPQDGDKRWHAFGNVWKIFCTNPGHNRYSNHSSKDCFLSRRAERKSVKMTSSMQLQENAGQVSVKTFSNDITLQHSEATDKSNGEVEVPSLPPPKVLKKLPATTMLLNDQEVETLIDWSSTTNDINPLLVNTSGAIPFGVMSGQIRWCFFNQHQPLSLNWNEYCCLFKQQRQ